MKVDAPEMVLHHVPWSRSFRVLWLLEELGLSAEVKRYWIGDGSMQEAGLAKASPARRVPALEIEGRVLAESGAIVQYLVERFCPKSDPEGDPDGGPGLGRAPNSDQRAPYLQWIHYSETLAALIEELNLSHVFLRPPAKPSPAMIKIATARLGRVLSGIEEVLADRGPGGMLLEDGFSAADIMMGFPLFAAPHYVRMDNFPALIRYHEALQARPAYKRAAAAEGPQQFYKKAFYEVPEDTLG